MKSRHRRGHGVGRLPVALVVASLSAVVTVLAGSVPAASEPDLWRPWRKPAQLPLVAYRVLQEAPARVVPPDRNGQALQFPGATLPLPLAVEVADRTLTDTEGVEVTFRFRLGRTPAGRLKESETLAMLKLGGGEHARNIALHAYSRGSGLFLNGLASGSPQQRVVLSRRAATPRGAVPWDTQWHTVTVAWCRGQLAACWDGLPVFRAADPAIDYRVLSLQSVTPGPMFGSLEMMPLEVRPARFEAVSAGPPEVAGLAHPAQ